MSLLETMLRRIDRPADPGATIITLSGGEPTLHPDLDATFCTISCVDQTAMLDQFRERPTETLNGILDQLRRGFFGKLLAGALRIKPSKPNC